MRSNRNNAWNFNGNNGFANYNNNFYNRYRVLSLSNDDKGRHTRQMIELSDIVGAYLVARQNKRRSADQTDFELHWEQGCVRLLQQVRQRALRPTAYSFVASRPKPREVFASDMATRVMHHYLDIRLRPLMERRLSSHTFNNRRGMGQKACQNAVISDIYEMSEGYTRDAYIIKLDMSGCFPNIVQDIAYAKLREIVEQDYYGRDKDEVLYILSSCIYSYPTEHCYRLSPLTKWADIAPAKSLYNKPAGIGAALGHLIWQNAVNVYFAEIDEWMLSLPEIRYERYVDDFYIVTRDKRILAYLVPELRQRLAPLGAKLNEHKFYCQHWSKGVECLGAHIKVTRVYVNNRVIRNCFQSIGVWPKASDKHIPAVISSLNSYIGQCKQCNGFRVAMKLWDAVPQAWKKYIYLDRTKWIVKALPGHTRREILTRKFNLISSKYGKSARTKGEDNRKNGSSPCDYGGK